MLHRFTLATASVLFVLMMMGGLVHNTDSSLVCPDWPGCHGQIIPIKNVDSGTFLEHYAHRSLGATLGVLSIILMIGLARRARRDRDPALVGFGVVVFGLITTVGMLGRYTVLSRLSWWASSAKLSLASLTLSLLVYLYFRLRPVSSSARIALPRRVQIASALMAALVYAQMVLGAVMRHRGAGLACLDVPLCRGSIWPSDVVFDVRLHIMHRFVGVLVFLSSIALAWIATKDLRAGTSARRLAFAAPLLAVLQVTLGVLSITTFLSLAPRTLHLTVAALLLCDVWSLHLLSRGALRKPTRDEETESLSAEGAVA